MERYFSLKSVKGPKAQLGLVLRSTSQGLLEDLTEMLSLKKTKGNRYSTNTNVDIFGQDNRKKELIVLAVLDDAKIKIRAIRAIIKYFFRFQGFLDVVLLECFAELCWSKLCFETNLRLHSLHSYTIFYFLDYLPHPPPLY